MRVTAGVPRYPSGELRRAARLARRWHRVRRRSRSAQHSASVGCALLVVALLVATLAIPVLAAATAYQDYQRFRTLGENALHHLIAAKDDLLPPSGTASSASALPGASCPASSQVAVAPTANPMAAPPPTPAGSDSSAMASFHLPDDAHLARALGDLRMARQEFQALGGLLAQPDPVLRAASQVSSLHSTLGSVTQLVAIGEDASTVGTSLLTAVAPLLDRLRTGALAASAAPLITTPEAVQLRGALVDSLSQLSDIRLRLSQVDPRTLPVSACERAQIASLSTQVAGLQGVLAQAPALFDAATWLAGVGQPRHFLVQTMDRAEIRPTGGFTGDFGILTLNGGRVGPFTLRDANWVYNNTLGWHAPAPYTWWPFGNWGLRDANLSPDFPTSAEIILHLYHQYVARAIGENDTNADGVIELTVVPIAHVLQITGPVTLPDYGVTVSAGNLDQEIHYWQNNPAAIARENRICQVSATSKTATTRKCFTGELGQVLEQKVRHLSLADLLRVLQSLVGDLRTHEIQIYVTNPQIESLLLRLGLAKRLSTIPGQDSLMVDQANVSVSKASGYVRVAMADVVTLDNHGGAAHHLTITFNNDPSRSPVLASYSSVTTYRDYVRVYVPPQAQLRGANGFDTGRIVCREPACPAHMFGDGSLICPHGNYGGQNGQVPDTGYPTSVRSDVPGLAMFGGYVTIPKFCTGVITLQYYVPHVALPSTAVPAGSPAYSLAITRQAGTAVQLHVRIQPAGDVSGETTTPIQLQGALDADMTLDVPRATG